MLTSIDIQNYMNILRTNYLHNGPLNTFSKFAILKVAFTNQNPDLPNIYEAHIREHNHRMFTDPFYNSGFDLFIPNDTVLNRDVDSTFIDLQMKTEMIYCDTKSQYFESSAYVIHPRSSISKTPLMLANHTGIIDTGYRGSLIAAIRWLKPEGSSDLTYTIERNTRLLQVCHPSLCRVFVMIVDETELSETARGAGGFGSTGR
jgi:dUTP pyrophosphatase